MREPDPPIALGIDIGGTAVKLALLRGDEPPVTARSADYARPSRAELGAWLRSEVAGLLDRAGVAAGEVGAVGVSVAGPLSEAGVLEWAANLPELVGLNVGAWVREQTGLSAEPVVMTDQTAAALCESRRAALGGRVLFM